MTTGSIMAVLALFATVSGVVTDPAGQDGIGTAVSVGGKPARLILTTALTVRDNHFSPRRPSLDIPPDPRRFSIVLPAKNEAVGLAKLLPVLNRQFPQAEIIVVDDGSTDDTQELCERFGVTAIVHPYSMGNGAAIKTGARHASCDIIVFMDADGQHDPNDIGSLLDTMDEGYEMVVGARSASTQASWFRLFANGFYNRLASIMTGHEIKDLTSGFRAVRGRHFRKFLYLLPNGFSYPTTSTMAFFRSAFPVAYIPIHAARREGKSHIRLIRDGVRFCLIIVKIGALFSPMRFFLPISAALFTTGLVYYSYTYLSYGRFSNMTAVLFLASLFTFLIGILSEQISSLHYRGVEEDQRRTVRANKRKDS